MSDRMDSDSNTSDAYARNDADFGSDGRYTGIGAELQEERLRCGLSLEDVSQRLRIRVQHLASIEEGRFGDLPGRIYAIGFVRSYAEFLGADGDVCVSLFKDEVGPDGHSRKLSFPTPPIENRRPGMMTLVVSVLLGALIYGGWYLYSNQDDRIAVRVPEVPERLIEQTTPQRSGSDSIVGANASEVPPETRRIADEVAAAPVEPSTDTPSEALDSGEQTGDDTAATSETVPAAPSDDLAAARPDAADTDATAETPAADDGAASATAEEAPAGNANAAKQIASAGIETPEPAPIAVEPEGEAARADAGADSNADGGNETAAAEAPAAEETRMAALTPPPLPPSAQRDGYVPRVFGITNRDARIVVRALEPAQIIVKQSGGRTLLPHRMMQPGDTYRVPNTKGVILESENIHNLEIFLDGQSMGSAGVLAAPAQALALSPDILRTLAR